MSWIIAIGVSVAVGVIVGIPYIRGVTKDYDAPIDTYELARKREYIKNNMDKFGVKD